MFSQSCEAERVKGGQCTRHRNYRVWCFEFQDEKYDRPTWVSTCSWHLVDARRIVSMLER